MKQIHNSYFWSLGNTTNPYAAYEFSVIQIIESNLLLKSISILEEFAFITVFKKCLKQKN